MTRDVTLAGHAPLQVDHLSHSCGGPPTSRDVTNPRPEGTLVEGKTAATSLIAWVYAAEEVNQFAHVHEPGDRSEDPLQERAARSARASYVDHRGAGAGSRAALQRRGPLLRGRIFDRHPREGTRTLRVGKGFLKFNSRKSQEGIAYARKGGYVERTNNMRGAGSTWQVLPSSADGYPPSGWPYVTTSSWQ